MKYLKSVGIGLILTRQLVLITSSGYAQDNIYPSWSSSGQQIAFSSNRDGNLEIYVMNKDGSNQKRMTSSSGNSSWPTWMGDTVLVFDSNMHGNQEIYSIRIEDAHLTRLTFDTMAYDAVANYSQVNSKIAFDSNREVDQLADVWIMDWDGRNQRQLTIGDVSQAHAFWSYDGQKLVFKKRLNDKTHELFEMNLNGGNERQLTNTGSVNLHPSYSPDDKRIVYVSNTDGDFDIYSLNTETLNKIKLFDSDQNEYRPSFSPDDKTILFCSKATGTWQIFTFDLKTKKQKQLTR